MTTQLTEKPSQRNQTLDVLKSVAIFMVVVGHVMVSLYPENYNEKFIFKICYSFHMPLFIFLAGGVTAFKTNDVIMHVQWIFRCFKRLMIPYFIWTVIYCLIDQRFDFLNVLLSDPILWYLINLFVCDLILFFSVHTGKIKYVTLVGSYIIFFVLYGLLKDSNLVIKNVAMFFPFYLSGHVIFRSKEKTWVKYLKKYLWIGALLYPVSMMFYTYKQYDLVIAKVQGLLGINSYGGLIHITALFYNHFVVATLGIMFIWFIIENITKINILKPVISKIAFIGQYTMFIYVLEPAVSYVVDGNFMNNTLLSGTLLVIIKMFCPLLIAYILSYIPKIRTFLFGQ